jgi:HK97 family phage major capsid protein
MTAVADLPGKAAIEYLQKNHALVADADFDAAKKHAKTLLKDGKLDLDQYTEICDGRAPRDCTVAAALHTAAPDNKGVTFSGEIRGVKATARYDSTKARKSYPGDASSRLHLGMKAGQDVTLPDGAPAYGMSQAERAMLGAWWKAKFLRGFGQNPAAALTDHEKGLLNELYTEQTWVGAYKTGGEVKEVPHPTRLSEIGIVTKGTEYLDDTTSGGNYLIPYFFDMDLVTYPLLYGELAPQVDMRELPISDSVKTPTLGNLTISAGPAEGASPGISLQTTTGLSTVLTSSVYNFTGALTVGRDMLTDTPIALIEKFQELFNVAQLKFLDKAIAVGDGSTYPLGISNTSSTATYTTANGSAGPWLVKDIEGIWKTLPKQYRGKKDRVAWVASDGMYSRMRGISVSSSDARRIYGYDYDEYMLLNRPFLIQNDLASTFVAFLRMDKYRMWRRKGVTIETSTEGKTLMVANELLIVCRSRWAGQIMDPNAVVLCVTGSKNAGSN